MNHFVPISFLNSRDWRYEGADSKYVGLGCDHCILQSFENHFSMELYLFMAADQTQFGYYGPQIKFCGWAYEMNFCFWNLMLISKNREKRSSVIEVQITK